MPPDPSTPPPSSATPFHLKIYHASNAFPPLSALTKPSPSTSLAIYPLTTLLTLTQLLTSTSIPAPIGTRFQYRHIYPSPASAPGSAPGGPGSGSGVYTSSDLGSVVLGAEPDGPSEELGLPAAGLDGAQVLKCIPGDAIFVAVLPPGEGGEVVPVLRDGVGGARRGGMDMWKGQGRERGRGRGDVLLDREWRRGEEVPRAERGAGRRGGGVGWSERGWDAGGGRVGRGGGGYRGRGQARGGERGRW